MKFIIEGSQSELTELIKRLGGMETEAKKADFPPLLTELAEDEKINEFTDKMSCALNKMNEGAKQRKENAPQVEAAEQNIAIQHLHDTVDDIKETVQSISDCRSMIASMRS